MKACNFTWICRKWVSTEIPLKLNFFINPQLKTNGTIEKSFYDRCENLIRPLSNTFVSEFFATCNSQKKVDLLGFKFDYTTLDIKY